MVFRESMIRTWPARLFGIVIVLMLLSIVFVQNGYAMTINDKYPGLVSGILGSAKLERLEEGILLIARGVTITESDLMKVLNSREQGMRSQLEKNLLSLLEQEATMRLLVAEAERAGIPNNSNNEKQVIVDLFERKSADVSVSDKELNEFYQTNRDMMGGVPFEQVKEGIRQYVLEEKKKRKIASYINGLGTTTSMRVDEGWVNVQSRLAMDNPVDKARRSGRATMVEFGATGCVPCDMMQPILNNLRKDYLEKLNVVFIHVRKEQILAARYGISSIPVQMFFDAKGKEVFRHVGFFPEKEVTKQLARMGVVR